MKRKLKQKNFILNSIHSMNVSLKLKLKFNKKKFGVGLDIFFIMFNAVMRF